MKRRRLVGKQPARASAPEAADTERTTATAANTDADPLEDVKNLQILGALFDLKRRWNVLDSCADCPLEDDGERRDMLEEMSRTLKRGSGSWQNPFGGDDKEYFLDSFCELAKYQQKAFFCIARSCASKGGGDMIGLNFDEQGPAVWQFNAIGRQMTDADLRQVLLTPPEPPFYVDPLRGSDEQKGSQSEPLASCTKAQELVAAYQDKHPEAEGKTVVKVTCRPPTCTFLRCAVQGCQNKVCKTHGDGKGTWENNWVDFDFSFRVVKCGWEGCEVAFCSRHASKMGSCDVCTHGTQAEAAMIGESCPPLGCFFCDRHLTRCRKRLDALTEDNGSEVDEDESASDECGFYCCPACIDSHRCGDNPLDYV